MPNILVGMGALFVIVGMLMGKDNRKHTLFSLGGALLLVYGVSVANALFIVLAGLFTIVSLVHMSKHKRK